MMQIQTDISDIELKQRWRLYWIHCIFEFSNIKLQKLSWIEKLESWSSSFDECHSSYFDNLALYSGYEKAILSTNVSKDEADAANSFHELAYMYEEPSQNPEDILKDEEWVEITKKAKIFWNYLKTNVTSQREIDLIQKLEKEFI